MCIYGIVFRKFVLVSVKINMCSSLNKWRDYVLKGSGKIILGVGGSLGYMKK